MKTLARGIPLALTCLAILLGTAPTPAATLPRLAGVTTVNSTGVSRAVVVSLPKAVTVNVANPGSWIKVSTPGRFGAIVIDNIGGKGRPDRAGLFFARLVAPAGCGFDGRCASVEAVGVRTPGSTTFAVPSASTLLLQAGTYRIYTVGDQTPWGRSRSFKLTLPGLRDSISISATQEIQGGMSDWAHNGPNPATYDEHPERAPTSILSILAPTWDSGDVTRTPVGPLYGSGVAWNVPASTVLLAGLWRSPVPTGTSSVPRPPTHAMCWDVSPPSGELTDYWWQQPLANSGHFTDPVTPRCLDAANVGAERAFALTRRAATARLQIHGNRIAEPGRRFGLFVVSVRLLDAQ